MKHLIVGSSGYLGGHLIKQIRVKESGEVIGTQRKEIPGDPCIIGYDLRSFKYSKELLRAIELADVLYFVAGISRPSEIEKHPIQSYEVNFLGLRRLIDKMRPECKLVYISSTRVFNGNSLENCRAKVPKSNSKYGEEKRLVEKMIIENKENHLILRVGPILGKAGSYIQNLMYQISHGEKVLVSRDHYFSPADPEFLSESILWSVKSNLKGVHHYFPTKVISLFEFLQLYSMKIGNKRDLVFYDDKSAKTAKYDALKNCMKFYSTIPIEEIISKLASQSKNAF